jgi:hypothetical protein
MQKRIPLTKQDLKSHQTPRENKKLEVLDEEYLFAKRAKVFEV